MIKIFSVLLALLISTGCIPKSYDYEYISLEEVSGIKIISYGQPEMSRVKPDADMPIRYELYRENYKLIIELDREAHWPSVYISAISLDRNSLEINPILTNNCGGFDGLGINYELDGLQALRYEWLPLISRDCRLIDSDGHQVIEFEVETQEGDLFKESLPFNLIKNGSYYETDGI